MSKNVTSINILILRSLTGVSVWLKTIIGSAKLRAPLHINIFILVTFFDIIYVMNSTNRTVPNVEKNIDFYEKRGRIYVI